MGKVSRNKKKIKSVEDYKAEGNEAFTNGKTSLAVKSYTAGLELLSKQQQQQQSTTTSPSCIEHQEQDPAMIATAAQQQQLHRQQQIQMEVVLRSNRAMAYIKEKNYEAALQDCNVILLDDDESQHHPPPTTRSTGKASLAKLYYRRAMAREGILLSLMMNGGGTNSTSKDTVSKQQRKKNINNNKKQRNGATTTTTTDYEQQLLQQQQQIKEQTRALLVGAQEDLQQCLLLQPNMKDTVEKVAQRLQSIWREIGGDGHDDNDAPPTIRIAAKPDAPQLEVQHRDIRLLLEQRRGVTPATTKPNEAFLLIDWHWWCAFCQATHLDPQVVAALLPRGAVPPILSISSNKIRGTGGGAVGNKKAANGHKKGNNSLCFVLGEICSTERLAMERQPPPPPPKVVVRTIPPPMESYPLPPESSLLLESYAEPGQEQDQQQEEETTTSSVLVLHHWLVRGYHYEILPREVYATLVEWYGQASPPIVLRVQANGRLVLYENINDTTTIPSQRQAHYPCAACGAPNAIKFCRPCQMRYCSRSCQERHWKVVHKFMCGKQPLQQNLNVDADDTDIDTTTTSHNNYYHHRIGLGNLGNTCFLNSAVQALAHTTPLVRYFLSGQFQHDINDTNPLGSGGGKLANAFDATMAGLRMAKPNTSSYSPIGLKRALAGTRFAGCQQHDAQEFLGYVLDGLHEDLNRITSYDYVELPDVPADQPHKIAGAQIWDAQCLRNNSLLWDTFYGQFKSTCVCPGCQQLSVSFDSFNHVSLEIPHTSARAVRLFVYMIRPDRIMQRMGFCMNQQHSTIKDLKMEILSVMESDGDPAPNGVTLCDVEDHDITTIFADSKPIIDAPRVMFGYRVNSRNQDGWLIIYCHFDRNTKERMGLPHVTSALKETATCREVWEELWRCVSHLVDNDQSKVQIRVMKRNGMPNEVFPVELVEEKKEEGLEVAINGDTAHEAGQEEIEKTSIWPSTSDALVSDYLSPTTKFLFLQIEWINARHITDQSLSRYADHPTYTRIIEELQAEKKMASTAITLEQCLSTFQKPERLDEHNMWYCNKCKEHVPAMKTIELWRLPKVLILHLKRFEFRTGFRREKLDMLVEFPLEGLEVTCSQNETHDSDALVDSRVPCTYDCFAVINHFGRMGFGHYTAFARQWDEQGMQDNWYLFDDSRTQPVLRAHVVSEAAYVLFYRRRE